MAWAASRVPAVAGVAAAAHRVGLLLDARGRAQREPARHEEVAGVAVGDVDDVALLADVLDIGTQHDLHHASAPRWLRVGRAELVATTAPFELAVAVERRRRASKSLVDRLDRLEQIVVELLGCEDAATTSGALDGSRSSPRSPRSPRSRRPFERCVT